MNFLFRLVEGLMYLMWEGVYLFFSGILRVVVSILILIFPGYHF